MALKPMALLSLLLSGAIFGFFYAWVCSTLWGLDTIDPKVAITAMQAMNASVRNVVFFPAFFLTPVVLAMTAWIFWKAGFKRSPAYFLLAALLYIGGAFLPTILVNVPMNEALALTEIPASITEAERIWSDYSARWQFWNLMRTIASGLMLMIVGLALLNSLRADPMNTPH